MASSRTPDKRELLDLELDTRLHAVWDLMGEQETFKLSEVGSYVRLAYAMGYRDACSNPDQKWIDNLGYKL